MSELVRLRDVIVVDSQKRAGVLRVVECALVAINELHLIPHRKSCPVRARRHRGEQGRFDNTPPHIDIDPSADHPGFTLAHEIGHFLDNQCLHSIYRAWASEIDSDFEELAKLWKNSRLVKRLRYLQAAGERRLRGRRGDLRYLRSLTTLRELWACTYAQWAATKSNFPPLKWDLDRQIEPTGLVMGEPYSTQWELDDFKDIMGAVDDLFRKRGWL